MALGLAILIAVPAGILAGVKQYSIFDYLSTVGANSGVSLPSFWIALMAIVIFAGKLGWFPPFGISSWKGYILPVIVLATEQTAIIARLMRSTVVEVLNQDYIRTARAKGLSETLVLSRHVVRNALLPVVTVIGYRLAFLLSGTIIIETVFARPRCWPVVLQLGDPPGLPGSPGDRAPAGDHRRGVESPDRSRLCVHRSPNQTDIMVAYEHS